MNSERRTATHRSLAVSILLIILCQQNLAQEELQDMMLRYNLENCLAAQTFLDASTFSISFSDHFMTKELTTNRAKYDFVYHDNILRADVMHDGYQKFGQLSIGLGYGRNFGKRLGIGLQVHYLLSHAFQYPSQHAFTIGMSGFYTITSKIYTAVEIYNPLHLRFNVTEGDYIPMHFTFHFGYLFHSTLGGDIYLSKELPGKIDLGIQLEYHPVKQLYISNEISLNRTGTGIHLVWGKFLCGIRAYWYYRISGSTGIDFAITH